MLPPWGEINAAIQNVSDKSCMTYIEADDSNCVAGMELKISKKMLVTNMPGIQNPRWQFHSWGQAVI